MKFVSTCGSVNVDMNQSHAMGVLNVTPDSFSDSSAYYSSSKLDVHLAFDRAVEMVAEGAKFIDVGGESTRPGAQPVSTQQELDRVFPVVEAIAEDLDCIISIDTSNPEVMRTAINYSVGLINDVRAFRREGALSAVKDSDVALCIMHMQGEPETMQKRPVYESIVQDVKAFLAQRIEACEGCGIDRARLIVDPGFGFGKTLKHNLQLVRSLDEFEQCGVPVLVGMSRKSMVGEVVEKPVTERLYGSLALASIAISKGCSVIRTHDVAATVDVIKMMQAVQQVYRD